MKPSDRQLIVVLLPSAGITSVYGDSTVSCLDGLADTVMRMRVQYMASAHRHDQTRNTHRKFDSDSNDRSRDTESGTRDYIIIRLHHYSNNGILKRVAI
jgi:hypothetical protein